MKILNLYACLGGNRYKWGNDHDITAVELDTEAARLYQERFPNDTVIVADAHQYLLEHYKEFDFIWSSPPCPTHSRARYWSSKGGMYPVQYPDLVLYQEILFLQHFADKSQKWVVENVIPYYEPLIIAKQIGRHLYWSNFTIPNFTCRQIQICQGNNEISKLSEFHDFDFTKYNGKQSKTKMARNLVDYEAGLTILNAALGIIIKSNTKQLEIEL